MITLARATSEREPPMTLGQWHNFVARYFALGIALKRAICDFDHKEDDRLRMEGGAPFVPELMPEHEALLSQQAQKRVDVEDAKFEKQMNYLAENDVTYIGPHSLIWADCVPLYLRILNLIKRRPSYSLCRLLSTTSTQMKCDSVLGQDSSAKLKQIGKGVGDTRCFAGMRGVNKLKGQVLWLSSPPSINRGCGWTEFRTQVLGSTSHDS